VPGFLGTLTYAVKAVLEKFGAEAMKPGDVIISNDPYSGGGNHLSDVALIAPIFSEGTLIAFSVNKAHWTEVGGFEEAVTSILYHGEKSAGDALAGLPKGTFEAEGWMDDDGLSADPIYVRVKITITDDAFTAVRPAPRTRSRTGFTGRLFRFYFSLGSPGNLRSCHR